MGWASRGLLSVAFVIVGVADFVAAGGWTAGNDFTYDSISFKIQTYTPDVTSSASSFPLTLCLHSSGSLGTDNVKQLSSSEPCYIWGDWKSQR